MNLINKSKKPGRCKIIIALPERNKIAANVGKK